MRVALACTSCNARLVFEDAREISCAACGRSHPVRDGIVMLEDPGRETVCRENWEVLYALEDRHFWFRNRAELIVSVLRASIGDLSDRSILELGCGSGFVLSHFERAGMKVCGFEKELDGLLHARRRLQGPLFCGSAERVDWEPQFDVVALFDVIEHVEDDVRVLAQARGALLAGGRIIVTVPADPRLWSRVDDTSGHLRRYTKETLRAAMVAGGFEVEKVEYFNFLILPAQVLARKVLPLVFRTASKDENEFVQDAIAVPPRGVNELLYLISQLERRLMGLPVPTGGSLIAVGSR